MTNQPAPGADSAVQQRFPVSTDRQSISDTRVRAAVDLLDDLDDLPLHEHAEVYTNVHRRLTEALGAPTDR